MICDSCLSPLTDPTTHYFIKHVDTPDNHLCSSCVKDDIIYKNAINGNLRPLNFKDEKSLPTGEVETKDFNEPTHYHKYEIDTIEFLQKGFPPEVFRGFAIGSIIKYLHRAQEKNGLEDYLKAEDYTKRLYKFEKEIGTK